jgi:hypothetical protein
MISEHDTSPSSKTVSLSPILAQNKTFQVLTQDLLQG